MASKRSAKKGMVKKAVVKTVAVTNESGAPVVRRPLPSAVELRAEREPAVTVTTVASGSVDKAEGLDDWAPPPVQLGWWERLVGRRRERKEALAEQMAAVKAGVLQELESMGAKKGIALKGSPFASVLLPTKPKKSWGKWWAVAAMAIVIVGIMVWIGRKPEQPQAVVGQAVAAVRNHDVQAFETRVDVAVVAASVVNQMFNVPPQEAGGLAARMTAFAKPGLAEGLKDEILAAVRGEELDDSGNTLLGQLWHALGGSEVRIGTPRIAQEDEQVAVAELPIQRADLNLALPLQVVMSHSSEGYWQVTDLPNLAAVLATVVEAERALAERRAAATNEVPMVKVESIQKARDDGEANNIIVRMVLVNEGTRVAKDVQLDVAFGDAAGQPMMTTRLTLDGQLGAGARREQVWSVPIDRTRAAERYVADLPLSALTVSVTVAK